MAAKRNGRSISGKEKKGTFSARKLIIWMFSLAAFMVFAFIVGYALIFFNGQRMLSANINKFDMAEATIIYDAGGNEVTRLGTNREYVSLDKIPVKLREAFIATEDKRFNEHSGIDFWAIGRALVTDIVHRGAVEGGSTITQQLAKNMFTDADKTFFRKGTEASMALALESNYTKDQILELYLNRIYFGNGAYGVKAAAKRHFGVDDLNKLTLGQIATLAGIPKNPSVYSPSNDPEKSKERRAVVLMLMRQQGYITAEEEQKAKDETYEVLHGKDDKANRAFIDYALQEAVDLTGLGEDEIYRGGYKVYTTLDKKAQAAGEEAFTNPALFQKNGPAQQMQGGMAIVNQKTGGIAALIGGRDYAAKGLNRALIPQQPGSSFKPLVVYSPALETGDWNPYSMLQDQDQSYGSYHPENYNHAYLGQVPMIDAVKMSMNAPAVWLLNEIGVKRGMDFVERMGIKLDPKKDRNLAIALGGLTNGASPLDMAQAYTSFPNLGVQIKAHAITKVIASDGRSVYEYKPEKKTVMSAKTAYYMTEMMKAVVQSGTGTAARLPGGRPVAGKTGSTQFDLVKSSSANRDIWFVGYTAEYTAAVWMGFDKPDAKHYVSISSGAAGKMFSTVMGKVLNGVKVSDFEKPNGVPDLKSAPAAVSGLSGEYSPMDNAVKLKWTPLDEGNVVYRLYRKEKNDADYSVVSTNPGTEVVDLSVKPGGVYSYQVSAIRNETQLEGPRSAAVEIPIPTDLRTGDQPDPNKPGGEPGKGDGQTKPGTGGGAAGGTNTPGQPGAGGSSGGTTSGGGTGTGTGAGSGGTVKPGTGGAVPGGTAGSGSGGATGGTTSSGNQPGSSGSGTSAGTGIPVQR